MGKVLRGNGLWGELDGAKEEQVEVVDIKFGSIEGEITIQYTEPEIIDEIREEYDAKLPDKPIVTVDLGNRKETIEVPSEKEKYEAFNNHPEAKEWREKVKPINKERLARIAYEFIIDDEKPSDDVQEGVEILQHRLRLPDLNKIVSAGMELIGFSSNLKN